MKKTEQALQKSRFQTPENSDRPYRLQHARRTDFASQLDELAADGFGGVVTNVRWHEHEAGKTYLCEDEDFADLDRALEICEQKNFGVWVYDEKGYPSGSADGLTLKGHPEYEARGFTQIVLNGEPFVIGSGKGAEFEKIIFAADADGKPLPFTEQKVENAAVCYAVRVLFEGSHAQVCGYGPRHYPNLMDKRAVAAFIDCTHERYAANVRRFSDFDALFTDEPSLMSPYIACHEDKPYAFLPWDETLPQVFERMHGVKLYSVLGELFDREDELREGKLMFWQTVAEMVNEAFFVQCAEWCDAHGIKFSGHCLLEERITQHMPLYGDLMKCLKTFRYPGVDMLTGDPEAYKKSESMQYAMAPKYVGSAARMTGRTSCVMVEICPLREHNGMKEYTLEQERGTLDLIFMAGANHINSYLTPDRLNGRFREYADYAARLSYVLRRCDWCGEIGMYYPIETVQAYYAPTFRGIESGAPVAGTALTAEKTMLDLYNGLNENGLDFTIIDAPWILEADLKDGVLSANGLEIRAVVMPGVKVLAAEVRKKLEQFEKSGGLVVYAAAKPDDYDVNVCAEPVKALGERVCYGIDVQSDVPGAPFVSPLKCGGKRVFYLINSSAQTCHATVSLTDGAAFEIWENTSGNIFESGNLELAPYTSVFVIEK